MKNKMFMNFLAMTMAVNMLIGNIQLTVVYVSGNLNMGDCVNFTMNAMDEVTNTSTGMVQRKYVTQNWQPLQSIVHTSEDNSTKLDWLEETNKNPVTERLNSTNEDDDKTSIQDTGATFKVDCYKVQRKQLPKKQKVRVARDSKWKYGEVWNIFLTIRNYDFGFVYNVIAGILANLICKIVEKLKRKK